MPAPPPESDPAIVNTLGVLKELSDMTNLDTYAEVSKMVNLKCAYQHLDFLRRNKPDQVQRV